MIKFKKMFYVLLVCVLTVLLIGCGKTEFTVEFDSNGGTKIEGIKVEENGVVIEPAAPTKENFIFKGWFSDETLEEEFVFTTPIVKDITLYAKWQELDKYVVKFVTNCSTKIEDIVIYKGDTLEQPIDIKNSGYNFDGWYADNEFKEKYEFGTTLNANLTLYAKWTEDATYAVFGVNLPTSYSAYLINKKEKTNKQTEFFDLNSSYYVGDDNAFNAKPLLTFIKQNNQTSEIEPDVDVESWSFKLELYLLDSSTFKKVEASEYIDSFDNVNCLVDFKEEAIGKQFKIVITPDNLTPNQQLPENISKYMIEMEIEIIDGYNVYSEIELAYFDNRSEGTEYEAWKVFKESNELEVSYVPNNLILHKDLVLKAEHVPSYFFYQENELSKSDSDYERALGSLKDFTYMFERELYGNSAFNLLGNYFTINTSNFKEVVRENGAISSTGEVISHATLFGFDGDATSKAKISNLNIIGNAPRVENEIKSGGQIFLKVYGPEFEAYNVISVCFFITYFPEVSSALFKMFKCKAYDAFNSFVYNYGSENVHIEDCQMIGAGGPVIIQDHVNPGTTEERIANTFIKNSDLQSYVTGTEGWFTIVGASSLVAPIKGLDVLFNPFNKSILKTSTSDPTAKYMNAICVNKANGDINRRVLINGTVKIDDYMAFDFGTSNPYIKALINQTFALSAPAFQTSSADLTSGYAYTDGATGLFDLQNQQIIDPNNNIYKGEYICIYYLGFSLVLGYNNVGDTIKAIE